MSQQHLVFPRATPTVEGKHVKEKHWSETQQCPAGLLKAEVIHKECVYPTPEVRVDIMGHLSWSLKSWYDLTIKRKCRAIQEDEADSLKYRSVLMGQARHQDVRWGEDWQGGWRRCSMLKKWNWFVVVVGQTFWYSQHIAKISSG